MADFVQSNVTKSAVRTLANPIADVATFNTIVHHHDQPVCVCIVYDCRAEP